MKLFAHFNARSGCDRHRILYPLRYAGNDLPQYDFHLSVTDPTGDYSYYLTHGVPPTGNLRYFGNWKRRGGKWILSLDDDMSAVPSWNPARLDDEALDVYHLVLDAADYILASTPALSATLGRPQKTLTAPNLMVVGDYSVADPTPIGGQLRIVWAGSKTHSGDLAILDPVVDRVLRKWGDRIEFIFVGCAPPHALRNWLHRGVHFEPGVPAAVYPNLLNKIRPHIALAPLVDCRFNESKSNIRVLEGWSLAAAVVASPIGEYRCIREGVDGEYATTADEWVAKIDRLLSDREYRESLATEGRRRVSAEYDWANPNCREPWRQTLTTLADLATDPNGSLPTD